MRILMTEIQLLLHEWGRTWILMIVREELKYVGGGRNTPITTASSRLPLTPEI